MLWFRSGPAVLLQPGGRVAADATAAVDDAGKDPLLGRSPPTEAHEQQTIVVGWLLLGMWLMGESV